MEKWVKSCCNSTVPNILLISGTSSRADLRENLAAANVRLSTDDLSDPNLIGTRS
ncbi:hypothetical protein AB4Z52_32660 [Rhizobium sp. 2YAF20]|uniref:hypothetical protein n=1 Tax=Rhizobium sp. 2YAF20 TaxID=3233027 RepID=UPI003F99E4A3